MEPQTTQSQPPKKSRTRSIMIAVGVLVALCLCVAIVGSLNRDSGTAVQPTALPIVEATVPPADTPTPAAPTPTPTLKQLIVDAMGDRNRENIPNWDVRTDVEIMEIYFPINDSLTTSLTKDQAKRDILNAAHAIYQATGNGYDMTFNGSFALQDAYGNVEESTVIRAQLKRATLEKINWDNLVAVELSQVADYYWEHMAFRE